MEGLLELLDRVFEPAAERWTTRDGSDWWDGSYAGRDRDVPFRDVPDQSPPVGRALPPPRPTAPATYSPTASLRRSATSLSSSSPTPATLPATAQPVHSAASPRCSSTCVPSSGPNSAASPNDMPNTPM